MRSLSLTAKCDIGQGKGEQEPVNQEGKRQNSSEMKFFYNNGIEQT